MKKIEMEDAFQTLPEIPGEFVRYCKGERPKIAIWYKRKGKRAECICGRCGERYTTQEVPKRNEPTTCPICKKSGFWEWERCTRRAWREEDITLVQCTKDKNIVLRVFKLYYEYEKGRKAEIKLSEQRRYFLYMGDYYRFYNENVWINGKWEKRWGKSSDRMSVDINNLYPGWEKELKESNLKYCDPKKIAEMTNWHQREYAKAMIAYANNPAIEMYVKVGMQGIVNHLVTKEGKTKLINRRAKTIYGQLRIKDKEAWNRLKKEDGNTRMLEVLQIEKKQGVRFTEQQREFLKKRIEECIEREEIEFLLRFMTVQQLINRTQKYKQEETYLTERAVIKRYVDYLKMREELEYDMTNEVFLYPKNLKEKHDQMVKERNERKDKMHEKKMNEKYFKIAEQYKRLCKKYSYEDEHYSIRPAKDAAEIVTEGRELHHCVGGEGYLRKHNEGKSFILFLRKKDSEEGPYYTIEIRGGEIIQWYGKNDTKPDKEIIGPWLENYVARLKGKNMRKTA